VVSRAKPGERFQFFRHGYYIADAKLSTEEVDEPKVFNQIVGLKSSWK
jgi:glutaminyl-tRNA synthetase